jgi:hypothetical protein
MPREFAGPSLLLSQHVSVYAWYAWSLHMCPTSSSMGLSMPTAAQMRYFDPEANVLCTRLVTCCHPRVLHMHPAWDLALRVLPSSQAFKRFTDPEGHPHQYTPRLTYVTVQKRHSTRLFPGDQVCNTCLTKLVPPEAHPCGKTRRQGLRVTTDLYVRTVVHTNQGAVTQYPDLTVVQGGQV